METVTNFNPVEEALSNILIVSEILKQSSHSAKDCRLVSKLWNHAILSLQRPRLEFVLSPKTFPCCDSYTFLNLCNSIPPLLSRCIKLDPPKCNQTSRNIQIQQEELSNSEEHPHILRHSHKAAISAETAKFLHACNNYSSFIQEINVAIEIAIIPSLCIILTNRSCPNLRHLQLTRHSAQEKPEIIDIPPSFPHLPQLTSLNIECANTSNDTAIKSLFQRIIDAAPNLQFLKLSTNFYADLKSSPNLIGLTILSSSRYRYRVNPHEFGRMLTQVSGHLKRLEIIKTFCLDANTTVPNTTFDNSRENLIWPHFPHLYHFRNDEVQIYPCKELLQQLADGKLTKLNSLVLEKWGWEKSVDMMLQRISWKFDLPCAISKLVLNEIHDLASLYELRTQFTNLKDIEITSCAKVNTNNADVTPLLMGPILRALVPFPLKRIVLNIFLFPETLSEFVTCLVNCSSLYKTLEKLEISSRTDQEHSNRMRTPIMNDLAEDGFVQLKQCLQLMKGMNSVVFDVPIYFDNDKLEKITVFAHANNIPVVFKNPRKCHFQEDRG